LAWMRFRNRVIAARSMRAGDGVQAGVSMAGVRL
jgi:hypothetical protein